MPTTQFASVKVLDVERGDPYDEETFRYFVDLERARAARAGRSLALLRAWVAQDAGASPLARDTASRLCATLRRTLRDTDVVGWRVQGMELGALLTTPPPNADAFAARVAAAVRPGLPRVVQSALRVEVVLVDLRMRLGKKD